MFFLDLLTTYIFLDYFNGHSWIGIKGFLAIQLASEDHIRDSMYGNSVCGCK